MEIVKFKGIDSANDLCLRLFDGGFAEVDDTWHGATTSSVYSRLYYVTSGEFYLSSGGVTTALEKGSWYLIPYGSSYEYFADEPSSHLFIHFNLSSAYDNDVFGRSASLLKLEDRESLFPKILQILDNGEALGRLKLKQAILEVLLAFIEEYKIPLGKNEYSACVTNAMRYIKANLRASLTVSEVSAASFVSKSTLEKHFRDHLSSSVGEFIDSEILLCAAQMILQNKTISEISEALGFCDQFYLSRKFKAHFGKSPREYRNSWHGEYEKSAKKVE